MGLALSSVALGLADGDTSLDIVTANESSDSVRTRTGSGDGTFFQGIAPRSATGRDRPVAVAFANVLSGTPKDLAVVNFGDNSLSIFAASGNGSYFLPNDSNSNLSVGTNPTAVVVADVDGDSTVDLIVTNSVGNTMTVIRQNLNGTFTAPVTYAVGAGASGVAVGNLNGDSALDLVMTNKTDGTVSILLNNGNGTFGSQATLPAGVNPTSVALADLNADGKVDLVTTSFTNNQVGVRLGAGDGTFGSLQTFATGTGPQSVAIADIDGDTKPDLVVANATSNNVSVLLGTGSGIFATQQMFAAGTMPVSVAVGDLDADGRLDIVTANKGSNDVSVLLQDVPTVVVLTPEPTLVAAGAVDLVVTYTDGTGINAATIGNGDLLVTGPNGFSRTVTLVSTGLVNGSPLALTYRIAPVSGSFSIADTGVYTVAVVAGQVADVAGNFVAGQVLGQFTVAVDVTRPTAALTAVPTRTTTGEVTVTVTYTDASGISVGTLSDGDLLVTGPNGFSRTVTRVQSIIATGSPLAIANRVAPVSGSFSPADNGTYTFAVVNGQVADVAGNTVLGVTLGTFTVDVGTATTPTYAATQAVSVGSRPNSVAIADLNGDGKLDAVSASPTANNVSVRLGNGDGTFGAVQSFGSGARPTRAIVADINGDQKPDLVTAGTTNANLVVLIGNGDGTFQTGTSLPIPIGADAVVATDLNGDSKLDLVAVLRLSDVIAVLINNGNGTFQAAQFVAAGGTPSALVAVDLNADNKPDIVTSNASGVRVLLGNGDGTFQALQAFGLGVSHGALTAADVNGDGKPDVITGNFTRKSVTLFLGTGDGTLQAPSSVLAGGGPPAIIAVDVDNDGDLDLAVANSGGRDGTILLGNNDGTLGNEQALLASDFPIGVAAGDLNADGKVDLVFASAGPNSTGLGVAVANWSTPTVTVVAVPSNVSSTPVGSLAVVFSQAVTGFDISDTTLTRNRCAHLLTGAQTVTTGDSINFTIGNLASLTAAEGSYTLTVGAGGSGVLNAQFNPLLGNAQTTFVIDTAGPGAVLTGIATLTTDGPVVFTVTFTDASGVSVNSTENAQLVTGPNGFSRVASWTTILSSNGSPRLRQYFINASDVDDFREINNGTYTVSLINGVVLDVLGNAATGAVLGTFIVSIDSTPPAAVLSAIPQVTTSGAVDIVVTFSDASGVVASTLPGSILVTGPNGSLQVATLVTTGLGNGSPLVATYRV